MGTIPAKDLLNKWKQNDLPIEMALGHLLQHLLLTENQTTLVQRKQQTDIKQVSHELETVKAELSQLQRDMAQVLGTWKKIIVPRSRHVSCRTTGADSSIGMFYFFRLP